jgi:hypothetical protein
MRDDKSAMWSHLEWLEKEVERLRAERVRLVDALSATQTALREARAIVSEVATWNNEGYSSCPFCDGKTDYDTDPPLFWHQPTCLIVKARAIGQGV